MQVREKQQRQKKCLRSPESFVVTFKQSLQKYILLFLDLPTSYALSTVYLCNCILFSWYKVIELMDLCSGLSRSLAFSFDQFKLTQAGYFCHDSTVLATRALSRV